MKLAKHHPLAFLISLVLLGVVSGYFAAMFFLEREVRRVEELYKDKEYAGSPIEVRDGGLFYAMIGMSAGTTVGLIVGLALFVTVKGGASESPVTLGLGARGRRRA